VDGGNEISKRQTKELDLNLPMLVNSMHPSVGKDTWLMILNLNRYEKRLLHQHAKLYMVQGRVPLPEGYEMAKICNA